MAEHSPKKLVVIDGKSVFYRGYYAMSHLSTKDGTPTGGVYGFATMALEVLNRLKPDYVAVAWDKRGTNIRRRVELYPAYKAGRKPAPPDFYEQIPLLHELLEAFGWPLYELDDYEADDIMGTLATKARQQGIETLLVTSDLDLLQVVNGNVKVFALKKGLSNIELYSPESFTAKYGIRVNQFLDLKSLKGDSSDNIPGVPGVGEKTAVQLLQQYDTLDGVYQHLDDIKPSVRAKLEAGRDLAYLSKQLAAIWTDAPLPLDLDAMDGHAANPERIHELLQRFEFRNLVRQLPDSMRLKHEPGQLQHHDIGVGKLPALHIIENAEQLSAAGEALSGVKSVVLYSRCSQAHGRGGKLLAVSPNDNTVYAFMLEKLNTQDIQFALGKILADSQVHKTGHDLKTTAQLCYELGMEIHGIDHDVMIGAFALDALRRDLSFGALAGDVGYEGPSLNELDDEQVISALPYIIAALYTVQKQQKTALESLPKIRSLLTHIELPVITVLAQMEHAGIGFDSDYMAQFARQIDDAVSDLSQEIYGYAEREFTIGSPSQLAQVLFEDLSLPTAGIKKGKTGYSTAASELDKLRGQHPIIDLITSWREVTKLKNTYVDTLPTMVDEQGRIHTTFNLTVAQTGRLSSTDPNLQNIPVRTELGRHIRSAFVAGPGRLFVSADYSQFELRLAAVMAKDQELIDMFNAGADIHTTTAAQVYGREIQDVTKQMRRAAKVINFGILYGMSPHGLAVAAGMTYEQANSFIDRYKQLRAPLFTYMDTIKQQAKQQGYVETLYGRRRPMPDIHSSNFMVRSGAERAAINMPIQGTEADLMKKAMIEVEELLVSQFPTSRQLLQIHDSILVEVDEQDADAVAKLLKTTMEAVAPELPVALTVDTTIGKNWGEL